VNRRRLHILGFLILFLSTSFLVGCAVSRNAILPNRQVIDWPSHHEVNSVAVGDTLVSKGEVYTYRAMKLKEEVTSAYRAIFIKVTVPPGELIARKDDASWTYYYSTNMTAYRAMSGERKIEGGIRIHKETGEARLFEDVAGSPVIHKASTDNYELTEIEIEDEPGFRQELIYSGRSGDTISFLYREFSQDLIRPDYSQEMQYDLTGGAIVGFKSVRLEIIEATNTEVTYKVLQGFPDL